VSRPSIEAPIEVLPADYADEFHILVEDHFDEVTESVFRTGRMEVPEESIVQVQADIVIWRSELHD
jgi:hypothetical protein